MTSPARWSFNDPASRGVASAARLAFLLIALALATRARAQEARPEPARNQPAPAATAEPAGWTHLRGPRWDGRSRETNLVDDWPERGPPVLWIRELGQGYSGFIAVGDRVWTQTQTLAGQTVVCLNADTGETGERKRGQVHLLAK